jgi:hypothetical protein
LSVWSVARVGQHLQKTTGVAFSKDPLRRLVQAEGFSFQRPQAPAQGQTGRGGLPAGVSGPAGLEKKALAEEADCVLISQDEREIHRHPTLTRLWALVGQQPEIPAPGKNEKRVVYGGVDYHTGKLTYTVAARKWGVSFLAFLVVLLGGYAGRKLRLVGDNGRFHTTKAVQQFLATHTEEVEVYW